MLLLLHCQNKLTGLIEIRNPRLKCPSGLVSQETSLLGLLMATKAV